MPAPTTPSRAVVAIAREAIRRVSFPTAAIVTTVRYWRRRDPSARRRLGTCIVPTLVVHLVTRDRDDGEPAEIEIRWAVPGNLPTLEHALDWIYACVRESWVHELDEGFRVDGRRRRDPHYPDGKAAPPPRDLVDPWDGNRQDAPSFGPP